MGLDMRAIAVARNRPNVVTETLAVWRKHPDLHGWVEDRARRYGVIGNINRAFAPLGLQDLDAMERDIRAKRLPKTEGLFFGSSSKGRAQRNEDLAFVERARAAIARGDMVLYWAWW
ncbi:hypothetical protein [Rhodobacter capsulatus]|jgi:hypothetical protein|nr:hypothetical protein [Rhodobacter capsulatus]ETD02060.1 phosphoglycerate kinase [Rhodobacter capsulatus DE442]ETD77734.1 phosphoglycerate kinase [Rhodobacter capsulatus R121]ETE54092.1 phosphoglycerate kinase [Rhodobacter capsulatus Y262]MDS0926668.1 phosphoglycerate kinase [Rhodobacter capsulatus]